MTASTNYQFAWNVLSELSACHQHVTANQALMFLYVCEHPGATATEIAKALTTEVFVTVASVMRGLDCLSTKGRKQYDRDGNLTGVTVMGLVRNEGPSRGIKTAYYLTQRGEDLLATAMASKSKGTSAPVPSLLTVCV